MTLCVFCYNSLKRANYQFQQAEDKRKIINDFLESDYDGKVEVLHFLEILKKEIGFEAIKKKVKRNLDGIKVATFYGCLLLRPRKEISLDDPESPTIFEDLFATTGAEIIEYPFRLDCCGSYVSVREPDLTRSCVAKILESAVRAGANAMVTVAGYAIRLD